MIVGLVGCGHWGANVLRDLRALGCDVLVVARSDASVARARAGGASAIVNGVEGLRGVAGVVVATTTVNHAAAVEEALGLSVPVFVEKPLCPNLADAARLAASAPDRLFVMDKWRYHPAVAVLAAIAREERLGTVHGLRTVRVQWGNRHDDVDALWILGPHELAIALEVLGEVPRPAAAVAHREGDRVLAFHALLWALSRWHAFEVSERSPVNVRRIELHCDDGVAVLAGGWDEHVSVYRPGPQGDLREQRLPAEGEAPLLAELRAFVDHLRGGPRPRSSAAEGLAAVEAIASLRKLAEVE